MEINELWRYPVKSIGGERLAEAELLADGVRGDRLVLVTANGQIVTARIRPQLLGFHGAELQADDFVERFDVVPLTIVTDGDIEAFGYDHRRLRPSIVISGVEGLAKKSWAGRMLKVGSGAAYIAVARPRCVMPTFDPDTLVQDRRVLQHIVDDLDASIALDCSVVGGGTIRQGDEVELIPAR